METDLESIKKIAKEKEDENWSFRTFLKGFDKNLDSIVHRLFKEISDHVDCTACGNCCREIQPILKDNDIIELSKALNIPIEQFESRFVGKDDDGDKVLKQNPCPFLQGNKCTQYESRPSDCISYPHLQKKHFASRLIGVINNYSVCPIVFNVYEELKRNLMSEYEEFKEIYDDEFDFL